MSWIEEANLPDLPAIFQALSLNPEALEAVKGLNETLAFGGSTLSRVQEEAIATVVAVANQCRYGALTHGGFVRRHSGDSGLASQLLSDYTQAELSAPDLKMLDFALKVTVEPASMTEGDLDGLRDAGFLEQDILSIVLVTCLFNFMNRVASSLGVEIPGNFQRVVKNWLTGPATENAWMLRTGEEAPQESSDQAREPATRSPGINVARGRKLFDGQRGTTVGGRRRVTPLEEEDSGPPPGLGEDTPEDADGGTPVTGPPEANSLNRFVAEACLVSSDQAAPARDLYVAYLRWCDENRAKPWRQRNFGLGPYRSWFPPSPQGSGTPLVDGYSSAVRHVRERLTGRDTRGRIEASPQVARIDS
jgi:uncharacterized peroxidase-related enzyme